MYLERAPSEDEAFEQHIPMSQVLDVLAAPPDPRATERYLHWDKLRRLEPPPGLSSEAWWWKIKFERRSNFRELPLRGWARDSSDYFEGQPFFYSLPDSVLRSLHRIDQRCSGEVAMDEVVTSDGQAGQRYLVNSLMEEAIRSSQLEGATTSRTVAKELLRSGREPRDRSERMILNNYRALQFMRSEMGDSLSPELVMELHRIVTDGTLRNAASAGRLQQFGEDRVAVYDRDDGRRVHIPPPADQLPERMELLCSFANEGDDGEQFIHPVVRAVLLHFWLAYDHPFEDGTGRTARILFYWLMRVRGYWLVEYLPISRILRSAPAQYSRAFLETETDSGDTTYFLIHQLAVIESAIEELHGYLRRKMAEIREVEELIHGVEHFNHRQLSLLSDALRHPDRSYSLRGHAEIHRVTHETARSDLADLLKLELLTRRKLGREYSFQPAPDLPERLRESGR
jgi:Fic family protein